MAGKSASRSSFLSGIIPGIRYYFRVPKVLFQHKLWPFQLLPAAISLLLSLVLFYLFYLISDRFSAWMDRLIQVPIEWLDNSITITVAVLSFVILLAGFFFAHKHIVVIALAPFLGTIAEETMKAVKGESFVRSDLGMAPALFRSAKINLRYIVREILTNLIFLCCGIIPFVGSIVSASGMFLTQARFLGYGLMDFPLENRGMSVDESDSFANERRGLSIGIGAGYLLLMMIPFVGWMFAPTFGTVAGTLLAIDELEKTEEAAA